MYSIWKKKLTLEDINQFSKETIVSNIGIEFIELGDQYLVATMPVDKRTIQPLGILHGGASAVLSETLGSMASHMTLDHDHYSVGFEIKANHIKSISKGFVTGKTKHIHLGSRTQIWDIDIRNNQNELICSSRLTMLVLSKQPGQRY